ncbi:hypothetical protein Psi01_29440 [Planobispora siamensis]|uniref:Uncharacterized protein n=2 Tax=Planobispora siamensis TaxID=936338 RepID=A0A8J3WIY5_9ACTN|nr:hypothetical protein Psi01_29440 [Planobispora siamensis]
MTGGCGGTGGTAFTAAAVTTGTAGATGETRASAAAVTTGEGRIPAEVSGEQYRILTGQCRYADTAELRERCARDVGRDYRVGERDDALDCRTYSGVSVCGPLPLSERERQCVTEAVAGGMTARRAEVECYVFS